MKERRLKIIGGGAVVLGSLLLYLATLDNGFAPGDLVGGDLITHQYAQAVPRLTNAPGYPLYTLLGWAWFRLGRVFLSSFFNPVEVLSLFSTIWGLGALLVLYLLLLESTEGNWLISGTCSLFYAATYFFWYYSVTTEEYTTGVLHTLLLVFVVLRWERTREDRYVLWLALLVGLALANLVTVLLALPAILAFMLITEPTIIRRKGLLFRSAILVLLPLLSYIYVYVQGALHPEWRGSGSWPSTLSWFLHFLSAPQGREEMTWSLGWLPAQVPNLIIQELTIPVLVAGLLGLALLGRRRGGMLYGILLAYSIFVYFDRLGNWFQVVMPAYPLIVMGMAVVANRLWRSWPRWGKGMVLAALVLLAASRLWVNFPRADQRDKTEDTGLDPGWAVLQDSPPSGAYLSGGYEELLALDYLITVWGERPDLRVVKPDELKTIPVDEFYLTKGGAPLILSQMFGPFYLSSAGWDLVQVRRQPELTPPSIAQSLVHDFGSQLRLLGYRAQQLKEGLSVTLYWSALEKMGRNYSVSVRPTLRGELIFVGGELLQQDHANPVWGLYPTSSWSAGEVVRDDYRVAMPDGVKYDGFMVLVYLRTDEGLEDVGSLVVALEG